MQLWVQWWWVVRQLRPACSRSRTFLWMGAVLAGMTVRGDLMGVASLIRALGLKFDFFPFHLNIQAHTIPVIPSKSQPE